MSRNFKLGSFFVILAALFWGLSGVFGQYLFQVVKFPPIFVTTIRLFASGVVFFIITLLKGDKEQLFSIFKSKQDIINLVLYSIIGLMSVQLTYYMAINYSNASTATIIQYLCPALIMIYIAIKNKKMPEKIDIVAVIFALVGIFLISTHGNIHSLSISTLAFVWGIASAFAMGFNTLMPVNLINKYGSPIIMSWGMIIGGLILGISSQSWSVDVIWDFRAIGMFICVVLVGTVAAFYCFFEGVKLIGPGKASLFVSIEPLMATIFTVMFMGAKFVFVDYIGLACITVMLILLAVGGESKE